MEKVREQSGDGLAVCDHIDFLAAMERAQGDPLIWCLCLIGYQSVTRGFIRETCRVADSYANLLQAAMRGA